jgi:uncharacterized protein (UPF0332 family)
MNAEEFIEAASAWASRSTRSAELRSATSRAYYGAYHLAVQFVQVQYGWRCRSDNQHQWIQRHFTNCVHADARFVGRLLSHLHEQRKLADYVLQQTSVEQPAAARASVERAEEVRQILGSLQPHDLQQIAEEMQRYRDSVGLT